MAASVHDHHRLPLGGCATHGVHAFLDALSYKHKHCMHRTLHVHGRAHATGLKAAKEAEKQ
jgi:hypothetical protein